MLQLLELQHDRAGIEAELGAVDLDRRRAPDVGPDDGLDRGDARGVDRLVGCCRHAAAIAGRPAIHCSRSASARALSARFLASVLAGPWSRAPSGALGA